MGSPTILTGLNVFQPVSFAVDRQKRLYIANGLNECKRWDGLTAAAEKMGIARPSAGPTVTVGTGGGATKGRYEIAISYHDDELPDPVESSISDVVTVTVEEGAKFTYSAFPSDADTRVTKVVIWRTLANDSRTFFKIAEVAYPVVGTTVDTYSDDNLKDTAITSPDSYMQKLHPDGHKKARARGVPPDHKPYLAFFQDRLFFAGTVRYTAGSVATNGTTGVTGTGTAWTSTMVGRYLIVQGETKQYLITAASPTSITTSVALANTGSGLLYAIVPAHEERRKIYWSGVDEPESVDTESDSRDNLIIQENTGDNDEITGLMPYGSFLYVLCERHLYAVSYYAQPTIDVSCKLVAARGCCSHRSWGYFEGEAYLMDQTGVYKFSQGGITPISDAISDIFRDGVIDWSKAKWFFAKVDPQREFIRFYVSYVADSSTRPKRWVEYHFRSQQWTTGQVQYELGDACLCPVGSATRVLLGGEDESNYLDGQGTSDHVSTAVTGTATSGSTTTLTDSTASFATTVVGAPIAIVSGTGARQIAVITTRNSGTQVTFTPALSTAVAAGSKYVIGAIPWNYRTGLFTAPDIDQQTERRSYVSYQPTTNTNYVDFRRYTNKNSSPDTYSLPATPGLGWTIEKDSPHVVLDLKSARSTRAVATGVEEIPFSGRQDPGAYGVSYTGVELAGYQGADQIAIHALDLRGFTEE